MRLPDAQTAPAHPHEARTHRAPGARIRFRRAFGLPPWRWLRFWSGFWWSWGGGRRERAPHASGPPLPQSRSLMMCSLSSDGVGARTNAYHFRCRPPGHSANGHGAIPQHGSGSGGGACPTPYPPPPPCISYALVQATVGVGTVIILYVI